MDRLLVSAPHKSSGNGDNTDTIVRTKSITIDSVGVS